MKVWDVAALVLAVGDALHARFPSLAVRGEVSGFSRASSGHCYFVLKDAQGKAAIRCVMFKRAATLAGFEPADGDEVELRGRLALYEPRGELQLVAESLQRAGDGVLLERWRRQKEALQAEGLFDVERKRPIAPHPRSLVVVTSNAAAALQDVLASLARRAPHVKVWVAHAPVQGADAPAALAAAITQAGHSGLADTLLLVRGGGSLEDLWAFNEAIVVRAVAACAIPVITGVGHETDTTLVDLAADLRAPTPTAAAELAATSQAESLATLMACEQRARRALLRRLDTQAQALDRLGLRVARPTRLLAAAEHRLVALHERQAVAAARALERAGHIQSRAARALLSALGRGTTDARRRVDVAAARLAALDPQRVLARGYAWLSDAQGQTISSLGAVREGQTITASLADGSFDARVTDVHPTRAVG